MDSYTQKRNRMYAILTREGINKRLADIASQVLDAEKIFSKIYQAKVVAKNQKLPLGYILESVLTKAVKTKARFLPYQ